MNIRRSMMKTARGTLVALFVAGYGLSHANAAKIVYSMSPDQVTQLVHIAAEQSNMDYDTAMQALKENMPQGVAIRKMVVSADRILEKQRVHLSNPRLSEWA